jgi:hypothetical protein
VAKVIINPKSIPERNTPLNIPGLKPPVRGFPYGELGSPEEADAFRLFIRQLRNEDLLERHKTE